MNEGEFKIQVLKTVQQWSSGLSRRLSLDENGISLFSNPAFESWLAVENWQDGTGDIVTDECGQTYWTAFEIIDRDKQERREWSLFRHNPSTGLTERVLNFGICTKFKPTKMWLRTDYLWILDSSENRVLALSRDGFQTVFEITIAGELIDIDLDDKGMFYALVEDGGKKICLYPTPPLSQRGCFTLKGWKQPVRLAVGPTGVLYILDTGLGRFIRFSPTSQQIDSIVSLLEDHSEPGVIEIDKNIDFIASLSEKLLKHITPSVMQIDERKVIYLASDEKAESRAKLHVFDENGSYLGDTNPNKDGEINYWNGIALPEDVRQIGGIGFDGKGGVYLATNFGLAKLSLAITPPGVDGVYYSKTLDNGEPEGLWHRVALHGKIPDKTSVEVYYFASDNAALKTAYDKVLSSNKSVEEKEEGIKNLFEPPPPQKPLWKGPEIFRGSGQGDDASPDMLMLENTGRFLWLKLRLLTFDEKKRPAIDAARIYYPRLSYLRYLPPAYREDLVSAAFLERFLSLFENIFHGLDLKIDQLFRYFDPAIAPPEFLRWLGSWINLSIDDDLPEKQVRQLIRRAPELFSRKGTPSALKELLEIYSGRPVTLIEPARAWKPFVLGEPDLRLGQGTVVLGSGIKGFRLGDTSVVGYSALRDRVRDDNEPFLPVARRFMIFIDMDREEFNRRARTLRRIVDEQKPAHTSCTIGLAANRGVIGTAILGTSASVTETQPYRVGVTPLGSGSAIAKGPQALRVERGAWVGSRRRL